MAEEKTKDTGKRVYQLASDYVSPRSKDTDRKKYMTWGVDNSFFTYLKELYLNSTTNNACINGINKLTYGQGLVFESRKEQMLFFKAMPVKEVKRALMQFYKTNKLTLQCEYEITKEKGGKKKRELKRVFYIPASNIGIGKKNEDGDIEEYYISENFAEKQKERYKPRPVPAFGYGAEADEIEIYYYQEELDGDDYFSPVNYHGALQYAESEVEQSNYHLNHLKNGFATNAVINFNNGVPDEPIRRQIVKDFKNTKTGSKNAGIPFITFNDGVENAVTISPYDIPNPHKQYEFINGLCEKKILLSHNVTSPLLFGVRDSSGGLGSNAKEIVEAYSLMEEMTLNPLRQSFLDGLKIISLSLGVTETPKFKSLAVFEGVTPDEKETTEGDAVKTESAIQTAMMKLSEKKKPKNDAPIMSKEDEQHWIKALENIGEISDPDLWDLVSVSEAEDSIEAESEFLELFLDEMPRDGKPHEKSKDGDSGLFKIRYRYGPHKTQSNSREFCKFMVGRAQSGVIYKREDIDYMSETGINGQFAEKGRSTYDIFKYKGGCYCHHRWYRVIYFRKRNADGSFMKPSSSDSMSNDKKVSIPQARKQGLPEGKLNTKDWPDAGTKPIDMPNRGKVN